MILVVGMSRPKEYFEGAVPSRFVGRAERMTGHPVLIAHYSMVTPDWLERYPLRAVFIEGFGYGWQDFDVHSAVGLWDFLHVVEVPLLAACGGHQLLGYAFTRDFRRIKGLSNNFIRRLRPGEPDLAPTYYPGQFAEFGVFPVQIVKRDPLFRGLPKTILVPEAHACEVAALPPDFELLATNENCRIQAMRHKIKPIYGTQFHAENWSDHYSHGERIIRNFFSLAGLIT
ncbi:MAG: gamma-glutamyl-gamma-aminobutyrate hydrolase family protein [Armatimonadota bacterium]